MKEGVDVIAEISDPWGALRWRFIKAVHCSVTSVARLRRSV